MSDLPPSLATMFQSYVPTKPGPRVRQTSDYPGLPPGARLIRFIAKVQQGCCILCASKLEFHYTPLSPRRPSLDHVLPRSLGGGNVGNYLVAHRHCNTDKGNRRPTGCELVWLAAVNARLGLPPMS